MIKTQVSTPVNVATHTTPLVTDFHTANNPCLFCTCGETGTNVCTEASSPRVLTIIERETYQGIRYVIGTANGNGQGFKPLSGQDKYTTPCAALAGAAKAACALLTPLPIKFTPIAGVDWNAINREVSARLYALGFSAYEQSGGDAKYGFCEVEQRIYTGPVMVTHAARIQPWRILDNEVTRQGWDAAAALEEADSVIAQNFDYDTDVDGEPVADSLAGVF